MFSSQYFCKPETSLKKVSKKNKRKRKRAKALLKENKVGLVLPKSKHYKVEIIKAVFCWRKDRKIDQCNGTERL